MDGGNVKGRGTKKQSLVEEQKGRERKFVCLHRL